MGSRLGKRVGFGLGHRVDSGLGHRIGFGLEHGVDVELGYRVGFFGLIIGWTLG